VIHRVFHEEKGKTWVGNVGKGNLEKRKRDRKNLRPTSAFFSWMYCPAGKKEELRGERSKALFALLKRKAREKEPGRRRIGPSSCVAERRTPTPGNRQGKSRSLSLRNGGFPEWVS